MAMLERYGADLTFQDLLRAKENGVTEHPGLDWKRDLNLNTKAEKAEFAKDCAAMANSGGGVLVFGVDEARTDDDPPQKTGEAGEIVGCPGFDNTVRERMDQLLRSLVVPMLPLVRILPLEPQGEAPVVLVQVGRSWAGPHMVGGRFHARTATGNHPMHLPALRRAFGAHHSRVAELAAFRSDRLAHIHAGDTTYPLSVAGTIATVHIFPLERGVPDLGGDFRDQRAMTVPILGTERTSPSEWRTNTEGMVYAWVLQKDTPLAYTQVFSEGGVEAATTYIRPREERRGHWTFPLKARAAPRLRDLVGRILAQPGAYGICWPILAGISLSGTRGLMASEASELHELDDYSPRRFKMDRDLFVSRLQEFSTSGDSAGVGDWLVLELERAFGLG